MVSLQKSNVLWQSRLQLPGCGAHQTNDQTAPVAGLGVGTQFMHGMHDVFKGSYLQIIVSYCDYCQSAAPHSRDLAQPAGCLVLLPVDWVYECLWP